MLLKLKLKQHLNSLKRKDKDTLTKNIFVENVHDRFWTGF